VGTHTSIQLTEQTYIDKKLKYEFPSGTMGTRKINFSSKMKPHLLVLSK